MGRKRVARLMREQEITGDAPRPFRRTTDSKHNMKVADNILDRRFKAEGPHRVWATDITYGVPSSRLQRRDLNMFGIHLELGERR